MKAKPISRRWHALMHGTLALGFGVSLYLLGVVLRVLLLPGGPRYALWLPQALVWYSGIPAFLGILLILIDLFVLLPGKRTRLHVRWEPPALADVAVVLTAYNDEASIGLAVRDFLAHPKVRRVIVVDNNSRDRTFEAACEAGATVVVEKQPGYGHCVFRALTEASICPDTELTVLCEGDMTFRAYDLDKLLAFAPHADIVNGTRIVEQLREFRTQLTTFMFYGNFFVGKLLEAKHLGCGTFTDVGTTYKLCRNQALRGLLPQLNPAVNLEFNAHFLDRALSLGFSIVECPVTFHDRVGVSKGGNVSNLRAMKVGLRMIWGLLAGWSTRSE